GDVCKYWVFQGAVPIIPVQSSCAGEGSVCDDWTKDGRIVFFKDLVDYEVKVKVTIIIVIEKGSHSSVSGIRQAILGSHFLKMRNAIFIGSLIYVQKIFSLVWIRQNCRTDINVKPSIIINVDN